MASAPTVPPTDRGEHVQLGNSSAPAAGGGGLLGSQRRQNFAAAAHPGLGYYLTMLGGLALSTLVVLATKPLLNRISQPQNARFE